MRYIKVLGPIKVIDFELGRPCHDIEGLNGYMNLKVLVRLWGKPIGYIVVPVYDRRCPRNEIIAKTLDQYSWDILRELICHGLLDPMDPHGFRVEDLLRLKPAKYQKTQPLVTVAVCTRDRTDELARCLDSLAHLDYPELDILVIDNAPTSDRAQHLVQTRFPKFRYVCEPRPGLDWARNRAIIEANGEIIAYTDDDVVVDPDWVGALVSVFIEDDAVMAVTGLVVPYELETDAQIFFEEYSGFGRGMKRKWHCLDIGDDESKFYTIGTGAFGTGANMAFRRQLFDMIGNFDPALDVGTVTHGGGDLEMFFRVLQEGHTLVYEPCSIVRHIHRRDYQTLRTQITNNGIGFFAYLVRNIIHYPRDTCKFVRFGIWWLLRRYILRLVNSYFRPYPFPRDLIKAEFRGLFSGLIRYQKARRIARKIALDFGPVKRVSTVQNTSTPELEECKAEV